VNVVVLGGYGNFGARICRALSRDASIRLIVAGRRFPQAKAFAASLSDSVTAAGIDTNDPNLAQQLASLKANLVIHTAGPFQGQDWHVPSACAEAGAHYIDLADGRRWVCDFPKALNTVFRNANRLAVTGTSTVPALSSAVVDVVAKQLSPIESIDTCIAPAQQVPLGKATLAAVLSYCGEPIQIWRGSEWTFDFGWAKPQRVRFARMKPRLGALCDIPDLELFPQRYPGVREVMFRAALEVGITQRAFAALAAVRRWRLTPVLTGLAGLLRRAAPVFHPMGTARGGMVVRMSGRDEQHRQRVIAWHLTADHHSGPEIPCMAAIILARRIARGEVLGIGAQICMGLVSLAEFQPEFEYWRMTAEMIDET
jgi:hypothetical protein